MRRLLLLHLVCVALATAASAQVVTVQTAAAGLSGATTVAPGDEVQIFSVGLTSLAGLDDLSSITLTISDLSSATGLAQSDFASLEVYRSSDSTLDGGDTPLASLASGSINIGSSTTISASDDILVAERFFLVSAVMSTSVTDGHAFRVAFANNDIATTAGGVGAAFAASDANRIDLDVVATQLVVVTQPSPLSALSGSSLDFSTDPVIEARDGNGNVDSDFTDTVTLTETGAGSATYSGNAVAAVAGVATFTGMTVTYTATADGESFDLQADDTGAGAEGDLGTVNSSSLSADVVATQLVFTTQPAPLSATSGSSLDFSTDPVIEARDAAGVKDTDFTDTVTLTETGAGSATYSGNAVSAVAGVATFTGMTVTYTATADGESFDLQADDTGAGAEGDLGTVNSSSLSADVVATQLVFTTQPAPLSATSGSSLDFSSDPVIEARDAAGVKDTDFTDTVTLTETGAGSATYSGNAVAAVAGVATFTGMTVTYTATADGESFGLQADDTGAGAEGDLGTVNSSSLSADVVATQMVFTTQPTPLSATSGSSLDFSTDPVIEARDGAGVRDTDFTDTVTLTETGAGSATYSGNSVAAVAGVATFTGMTVTYTATADGESFDLQADDTGAGAEGDLGTVNSSSLSADVVATQLVFTTQPSPLSATSGSSLDFSTDPVIEARDAAGVKDTDFTDTVTLTETGAGSATYSGNAVSAVAGVATFTGMTVTYTATADGESFDLQADDTGAGAEGDLGTVNSSSLSADVVATQLVFTTQPSPLSATSGSSLDFSTDPVIEARDAAGVKDTDFTDTVTLTETGAGSATYSGNAVSAVAGVATFTGMTVTYTATADGEAFDLQADDTGAGAEGDLGTVNSSSLSADVVATQLVFITQPSPLSATSGSSLDFSTDPVIEARDAAGVKDTDFTDTVTLTETGAGSATYSGNAVSAVAGVATFTGMTVTYTATADGESFDLQADDTGAGVEGDLGTVNSSSLSADVVATHLVFGTQPPANATTGVDFTGSVTVEARDGDSALDTDFSETVTLASVLASNNSSLGAGTLASADAGGLSQSASAGVASWTDLTYDTAESIDLRATSTSFTSGSGDEAYSSAVAVSAVPADSDGTLTAAGGVVEPVDLPSTATSAGAAVDLFDFTLSDGGGADGLSLDVSQIVLNTSGAGPFSQVTWRLDGPDASDVTGTYSGGGNTITFSGLSISVADGGAETYAINAYFNDNSGLTEGDVFQLSIDGDTDLTTSGTQMSGANAALSTGAGSAVDVVATQLVFATQPSPLGATSGSSLDFSTDPIVEARDAVGNVDTDFTDTITLTETGAGSATYSGNAVAAVAGVATFTGMTVTYTANADGESFDLQADDTGAGAEGDLGTVNSSSLSADVVATQLVFTTQPAPLGATSGSSLDFSTDPVVEARDGAGVKDTDFTDTVTLTETGAGSATYSSNAVAAVAGVATFTGMTVTYTATADGESFDLQADDTGAGAEGDLGTVSSSSLSADVVATQLVFTTQPAPLSATSGSSLDFSTDPVIEARDAAGMKDTDFTDTVTLTETGAGSATYSANAVAAVAGVATFTGMTVTYTATADGESFDLQADDTGAGAEGDLGTVSSSSLSADVVATHLVFGTQPPANATTGVDFSGSVTVEARDGDSSLDADFTETVTLASVLASNNSSLGAGTLASADAGGLAHAASAGVASWTDLTYDTAESIDLRATSTSFTAGSGDEAYSSAVAVSAVPADSDGTLTAAGGVVEPVDLPSTATSAGAAVDLFDFTLSDGGGADGLSLDVSQIVLNTSGAAPFSQVTWRLDGPDASAVAGTYSGGGNTITFSGLSISVADGGAETYTVDAYYNDNSGLTEGDVFQLSIDGDTDLTTSGSQMSGANAALTTGAGSAVDVVATQLVFATQPAPLSATSGSSLDFSTDPVIEARDAAGNVDTDVTDTVTLTETGVGSATYSGNAVAAVAGVATFTGMTVTYTATTDGETFDLQADDTGAGAEGDLGTVNSSSLSADVVATQLVFTTQPAPLSATSGSSLDFSTDPVIEARDAAGVKDTDFTDTVTLTETGAGSATYSDNAVSAVAGVATFTGMTVTYTASADGETFDLQADDTGAGAEGDLGTVNSSSLSADVVATHLVFGTQPPANATTGVDFSGSVTVEARDGDSALDTDFSETVTLASMLASNNSTPGNGSLASADAGGLSHAASAGVASWTDLTYDTAESIDLRATSASFTAGSGDEAYSSAVAVSAVPPDSDGTLTAAGGVVEPVDLPSTATSAGAAVDVFDFTLSDGGGADGLSLDVSQIVLNTSGAAAFSQVTWRLDGPDASAVAGTYSGGANTITFSGLSISVTDGGSETYTVNAYFNDNTGLTEGDVFQLSIDGDTDLTTSGTQMSGANAALTSGAGSAVDVVATQLVFATQPSPLGATSGSSLDFSNDPVIEARDAAGNVDTDFTDTVTLTETGAGSATYSGNAVAAVAGVATFTGMTVTYTATADGESFDLQADDTGAGAEGDLGAVNSSSLSADVVATQLVFGSHPPSTATIGTDFSGSVSVEARDGNNTLDADFVETVDLAPVLSSDNSTAGTGTLASADGGGLSQAASSGVADWTDLTYNIAETIDLRATSTSFAAGSGNEAYSSAVALSAVPPDSDGSLSAAGGVSEPVALSTTVTSAGGAVDVFDFTLSDGGGGDGLSLDVSQIVLNTSGTAPFSQVTWRLDGPDASAVAGSYSGGANTITFSGLSISVADGGSQTYSVDAYYNDNSSLTEGDVFQLSIDGDTDLTISGTQMSGANTALTTGAGSAIDVVATQLVFATQPAPLSATSGSTLDFDTDPVIEARDAAGNVDADFTDTVTLSANGAGSATFSGNAVSAVAGIATFGGMTVTYTATNDGESFQLQADDTGAGAEGDLGTVNSSRLSADIVATRLVFTTQPPATATTAVDFSGSIAVEAHDSSGLLDTDFVETVRLAAVLASNNATDGTGSLASADTDGLTQSAVGGRANWVDLTYSAAESIDLRATSSSFAAGSSNEAYSSAVSVTAVPPDADGSLVADGGVDEPVDLPSTATSAGSAIALLDFTLSDGGGGDGLSLDVSRIVVHADGDGPFDQLVWRLSGPDVSAVGTWSSASRTIAFDGLGISVADAASQRYTVSAYFDEATGLTEGQVVRLSLDGDDDVTASGSQMSGANTAVSNGSGSVVTVSATRLVFVTQPAGGLSGSPLPTQPVVEAQDDAGNRDRDFTEVVSLTASGQGALTGASVAAVAGRAVFTAVTYTALADAETVAFVAADGTGGLDPADATSSSVAISVPDVTPDPEPQPDPEPDPDPDPEPAVAQMQLSPTHVDFGTIEPGQEIVDEVTVSNPGTATLSLSSLSTTDGFRFDVGLRTAQVPPGTSLSVPVTFSSLAPGTFRDTLRLVGNVPAAGAIPLVGRAFHPPALAVDVDSVRFGDVFVDSVATQTVQVGNTGGLTLVATLQVDRPFMVSPSTVRVAPGDLQGVTLTFQPREEGHVQSRLRLESDENTAFVELDGSGIALCGHIDFNCDGDLDSRDLLLFSDAFGQTGADDVFDLDGDGGVSAQDLLILADTFSGLFLGSWVNTDRGEDVDISLAGRLPVDQGELIVRTPPANGTVEIRDGVVSYRPDPLYRGLDAFTVVIDTGNGVLIERTLILVAVDPINHPPRIHPPQRVRVEVGQLLAVEIPVTDEDDNLASLEAVGAPAGVMVTSDRLLTWRPVEEQAGLHVITLLARDASGSASRAKLTINVSLPVAGESDDPSGGETDPVDTGQDTLVVLPPDPTVTPGDTLVVQPPDSTVVPGDTLVVQPPDSTVVPGDTLVVQPPDSTVVPGDTLVVQPPDSTVVPGDTLVVQPPDSTIVPGDTLVVQPPDSTIVPGDTLVVQPPDSTVVPGDTLVVQPPDSTVVPGDTLVVQPPDSTVAPGDTLVVQPPDSTVVPGDTLVVQPPDSTVVPGDTLVVQPPDSTVVPGDTLVVQPPDSTVAPGDTLVVQPPDSTVVPGDTLVVQPPDSTVVPGDTLVVQPPDSTIADTVGKDRPDSTSTPGDTLVGVPPDTTANEPAPTPRSPVLSVTLPSDAGQIDFDTLTTGTTAAQIITLTSTGDTTVTLVAVDRQGGRELRLDMPALPLALPAGSSADLLVRLEAGSPGQVAAVITFVTEAGARIDVPLTAQVVEPPVLALVDGTPADGAVDVDWRGLVELRFSDALAVVGDTPSLSVAWQPQPLSHAVRVQGTLALIDVVLLPGTHYRVGVTHALSANGLALEQPVEWSFTTAEPPPTSGSVSGRAQATTAEGSVSFSGRVALVDEDRIPVAFGSLLLDGRFLLESAPPGTYDLIVLPDETGAVFEFGPFQLDGGESIAGIELDLPGSAAGSVDAFSVTGSSVRESEDRFVAAVRVGAVADLIAYEVRISFDASQIVVQRADGATPAEANALAASGGDPLFRSRGLDDRRLEFSGALAGRDPATAPDIGGLLVAFTCQGLVPDAGIVVDEVVLHSATRSDTVRPHLQIGLLPEREAQLLDLLGAVARYKLKPNFPNPFNPETTIVYVLPFSSPVRVAIYNALGQRVRTLVDRYQLAGRHHMTWLGVDDAGYQVADGIYFVEILADRFRRTRKMTLLR